LECPNGKFTSLAECEVNKEEEDREVCLMEEQEEVVEDAEEGGLLVLSRASSGLEDGKKITLAPLSPSKLHQSKPPNTNTRLDLFFTLSEPLPKASHHESKAFKGCILTSLGETEAPIPTHPLTIAPNQAQANKHERRMVFQRFPSKRKSQLMPRTDDPFEVHKRVNDNAYKVNCPETMEFQPL